MSLADLPNLGPVTARQLAEVGIETPEDLRAVGAAEAYRRLKFAFGRAITLNALRALEGAVTGVDWRHIDPERLEQLKREAGA